MALNNLKINPITGKLDLVGLATGQGNIIWTEVPTGAINGINKTYTLTNNVSGNNLMVFLNGVLLDLVTSAIDYDEFEHVSDSNTAADNLILYDANKQPIVKTAPL